MADAEEQDLLLSFVEEGNELLDESELLLTERVANSIESGETDIEALNTSFRLFHSLGGGAGFLHLHTVRSVTDAAVALLDLFRKGTGAPQSEHIDILTSTCNFLRRLLNNIKSDFTENGFEHEAEDIIHNLREKIGNITGEELVRVKVVAGNEVDSEPETKPEPPIAETVGGNDIDDQFKLTITPEMTRQFVLESNDLLSATEQIFLQLEKKPHNQEQIGDAFRALHSFKGNCGFLSYVDLEKLSHLAETVLDSMRYGEIEGNGELFSLLLEVLDSLKQGVALVSEGQEPTLPAATRLGNLLQDSVKKLEDSGTDGGQSNTEPSVEQGMTAAQRTSEPPKSAAPQENTSWQSIRVDVEKLEALLDLVGELVIAEAMVAQNPDLKNLDTPMENFERSSRHLNKITRDLQDIATAIRMVPLSGVFRRTIRLVRDLTQKTGKKVELEIIGEQTEVDKTIIEQITDPLVHIIRNSIDHGIGKPKDRKKLGKPEAGHLTLEAKHVGGEVWISIKDDGRGLDREKILAKAVERGLIDSNGDDLSDNEVWHLVFQPGFSTADRLTDVSGRGVGMDVVKRNIENIRGKVDIISAPGECTEVILKIPLTLAIIDGMTIRVGDSRYIVPLVSIKETLRANADDITHTMDGQEIINIRGHLYAIVRLHECFGVEPTSKSLSDGIIMMVEDADRLFCIFVDELIGQQQVVIKGLSGYIGKIAAVSGCTILSDGAVCLIIDIASLADIAENGRTRGQQGSIEEAVTELAV